MKRESVEQIPPKWVVRTVSCALLFIGAVLVCLAIVNFTALGFWFGVGVFVAGLSLATAAFASLYTGNPEWILLNLILPV